MKEIWNLVLANIIILSHILAIYGGWVLCTQIYKYLRSRKKPSKMKYKQGDKVTIKSLKWYNENEDGYGTVKLSNNVFHRLMSKYCGKTLTILHVHEEHYILEEGGIWSWTDEMLE